ncbi:Rcs stress response system protein RcsF [Thorsellia anophelis]|uniref:RcsF protein n=1 Tax=Thorsellia anophelis DSM 18579 TaxID=1123402 RepID=A0A1I0A1Y3_9GAMM|nr:Rcs stress response system protein RcsF [Thorsellia anophelis]SES87172.1 RcsF protein [Thorsellia anophelis DSM 18579]
MINLPKVVLISALTLSIVSLTACSLFERNPPEPKSSIVLFDNPGQLTGISYKSLGDISGAACQVNASDPVVTVRQAEQQIQRHAQRIGASAVLVQNCEILQGTPGCVRQTVCKGEALKFGELN